MDNYLPQILIMVLSINVMLFTAQVSIMNVGVEEGFEVGSFYSPNGSMLCQADSANCAGGTYILNNTDPTALFPDNEPIDSGDGNFFTDMFGSIKTFFSDTLGLGYVFDLLSGPSTIIKMMGVPQEISFALGAMWYLFTFLILMAFFWGR